VKCLIYALVDPRTEEIRYIGKSSRGMVRPRQHSQAARLTDGTHKANWIKGLVSAGMMFRVSVLEELSEVASLDAAERRWIARGRSLGWPLTNATDGGDGTLGLKFTEEHRRKIAMARLGKQHSPETRARMSTAKKGKPLPPSMHSAALAVNIGNKRMCGKKFSLESRLKMSRSATICHQARRREVPPRVRLNLLPGVSDCSI
jgi:hypothetical protein